MASKKLRPQLDDLTTPSTNKGLFSFGKPPKAKIDNLVMKPPKVLPRSYVETLIQERKSTLGEEFEDLDEKELLEYLSVLQSLEKKEEELKIGILYEKLKKKEHISALTKENIDQLQQELEQTKESLRMRQVYSSKKQFTENLRKIMQPRKNKRNAEAFEYTDEERIFIRNLMLEKKQKEKEINLIQKQISENEKSCLQLRTNIDEFLSTPTKPKIVTSTEEELKDLKEENDKRSLRIQLLSKIAKALIDNISTQSNLKDDLKLLALSCENISKCNSEDVEELEELVKMVYSTKI